MADGEAPLRQPGSPAREFYDGRSALIRETRPRVSRFRSARSPNSGATINFQRRSSPAFLPDFEPPRNFDGFFVAPMGSPISGHGVLRVQDPHSTPLVVRASALRAPAESNRPALPGSAHASMMHQ